MVTMQLLLIFGEILPFLLASVVFFTLRAIQTIQTLTHIKINSNKLGDYNVPYIQLNPHEGLFYLGLSLGGLIVFGLLAISHHYISEVLMLSSLLVLIYTVPTLIHDRVNSVKSVNSD